MCLVWYTVVLVALKKQFLHKRTKNPDFREKIACTGFLFEVKIYYISSLSILKQGLSDLYTFSAIC